MENSYTRWSEIVEKELEDKRIANERIISDALLGLVVALENLNQITYNHDSEDFGELEKHIAKVLDKNIIQS